MTASMSFEVWAPWAHEVELEIAGERHPLTPRDRGAWRIEITLDSVAYDYRYILDEGPALPDPRSPWQPQGVYGPSRTVDHRRFRWRHAAPAAPPVADRVLYELHIGTCTTEGTFDAALEFLPHLVTLGVTHIELMPVAEFPGSRGWGYDGVFLYAPHHRYGGPDGLKRFVDEAHGLGLCVLLDVVYSHLGPLGNPLPRFAPYLQRVPTGWGDAMNLDGPGSDEVRRFLLDNVSMWLLEYRFDGLRLDAVHAYQDVTALTFLEELSLHVDRLGAREQRKLELFVESDRNDPRPVLLRSEGGFECTALWSDDFHHALHAWLSGETHGYYADFGDLAAVEKALTRGFVLDGAPSVFRRRRHGRSPRGLSGSSLCVSWQNHDQVGNRPHGERAAHLLSPARQKIAAAVLLLGPCVPLLFQGEEWAAESPFPFFCGDDDADLCASVDRGRAHELAALGFSVAEIPAAGALATFLSAKLDHGAQQLPMGRDMLDWYRALLQLRRCTPSLWAGPLEDAVVHIDHDANAFSLRRGDVMLAAGLAPFGLALPAVDKGWEVLLDSSGACTLLGREQLEVPTEGCVILRVRARVPSRSSS